MSASATIRPARADDADGIAAVHALSWAETYAGLVPEDVLSRMTDPATRQPMWRGRQDWSGVFVAALPPDAGLVGFGLADAARDPALGTEGEVQALYVRRAQQGLGLGTALLLAMFNHLVGRGMASVGLWVLAGNVRARAFYARRGATEGVRRTDREAGWRDEVAMVWMDVSGQRVGAMARA